MTPCTETKVAKFMQQLPMKTSSGHDNISNISKMTDVLQKILKRNTPKTHKVHVFSLPSIYTSMHIDLTTVKKTET